jgi:serine/threonine protein kinase
MHTLHSKSITHRSVKLPNLPLGPQGQIRASDSGFAKLMAIASDALPQNTAGAPPEFLDRQSAHDFKVDVCSYGIVRWEMLIGAVPRAGPSSETWLRPSQAKGARRFPMEPLQVGRGSIEECRTRDRKARPTFDEILRRFRHDLISFPGANGVVQDSVGRAW